MAEKREKLWLRCVNLGENPSYAEIATFVKSVSIADLGLDLNSGAGLSHYEVEPKTIFPSIEAFKKLCHYFYSTFEYWMRHKDLTDEQVKWIDNNMLNFTLNFRKMSLPNHKFDLMMMQERQPIIKFIVTQFAEFLDLDDEVRQCAAEDCKRYFFPNPSGKEQKFCSNACKQKAYRKRKKLS